MVSFMLPLWVKPMPGNRSNPLVREGRGLYCPGNGREGHAMPDGSKPFHDHPDVGVFADINQIEKRVRSARP